MFKEMKEGLKETRDHKNEKRTKEFLDVRKYNNRNKNLSHWINLSEWIKQQITHGLPLNHKKNKILPFVKTWMDLKGIMLSEISQTEKDKYFMISLICGI